MSFEPSETFLEDALSKKPAAVGRAIDKLLSERRLRDFLEIFWMAVEPSKPLVPGWPLDAVCEHLEAVARGHIKRLLINIFPGATKSLTTNVFFPAWIWGPLNLPNTKFLSVSYSQSLTIRDNRRFRQILTSSEYQELWGDRVRPSKDQFTTIEIGNDRLGWKMASSVDGAVTGNRADIVILDDPNSVKDVESERIREATNEWFRETLPTRLNDARDSSIIVIQQRTHEVDVSGTILDLGLDYIHLCVPMEYDSTRHCTTVLKYDDYGLPEVKWQDPRGLDEDGYPLEGADLDAADGALAWAERFPAPELAKLKEAMGPYAYNGQLNQSPVPRGGGIFKRDWWRSWPPDDWPEEYRQKYQRKFPDCSYVIASLDPAMTEDKANDFSAFTVWGVWKAPTGVAQAARFTLDDSGMMRVAEADSPKILLMYGWQKRLELHGPPEEKPDWVTDRDWNSPIWVERRMPNWGLVETVQHYCRIFKVDLLLIENKGGGHHVSQELIRLLGGWEFAIQLVDVGRFDKVARAHSVVHLFSNGIIFAPKERQWCEDIITAATRFPKGKHDDVVDSAVTALAHLRDARWAVRTEEAAEEYEEELRSPARSRPLYPA